ncbi:hypothetical protein EGW08_017934 [Elysia chlorotica]|uniref:ADF-H domain-containing protein n=1 Tax=Elysia chlorotica TaxID=188477 RepID=A0A433SYC1_ELYCH|nr:hypothetical protein EGW08_017934 [Elysia chlorotica]
MSSIAFKPSYLVPVVDRINEDVPDKESPTFDPVRYFESGQEFRQTIQKADKMATGVKLHDEVLDLYNKFKLQKTNHRFVVMIIEDGLIKLERTVDKNENLSQEEEYSAFINTLPTNVGRYFWADLKVTGKSGASKDVMFLVSWNPDGAPMTSNILYSMSLKALTEKCHADPRSAMKADGLMMSRKVLIIYSGKGDALDRGNYCGLKLTEQVMKVLERIVDSLIRQVVSIDVDVAPVPAR